jgi:hypothetical protein
VDAFSTQIATTPLGHRADLADLIDVARSGRWKPDVSTDQYP